MKKTLIGCGLLALALAGVAAAYSLRTIYLAPGSCTKVAKTRVCARTVAPTPPVTVTVTPIPAVAFKDGTYRVGADIQAGTYEATNAPAGCYWERLSGFGGTLDEIIANDFTSGGNVIVTIASSDVGFHSNGCGAWSKIG